MRGLLYTCLLHLGASAAELNFQDPDTPLRPHFRYWIPDCGVDLDTVVSDIQNADAIGAGGVELLPFFNYGSEYGAEPPGADWAINGFGNNAYNELLRRTLIAHKDSGRRMDFALGPAQGQGVPAYKGDPGLQWDLVPFSIPLGNDVQSFNNTLPGWGTGNLVAIASGLVSSKSNVSLPTGGTYPSYLQLNVDDGSLDAYPIDTISADGHTSLSFNNTTSSSERWLFAFYERQTLHKNVAFPNTNHGDVFDNGSFTVDHFSANGAMTTINFWKEHILSDEILELLKEAGGNAWEDSMELRSNMSWTPDLPAKFKAQHGYGIEKYMPLLMWGNNNIILQTTDPGQVRAVLNTSDAGQGYINDYRKTLTSGYLEYLNTLSAWAHEIGVGLSLQPSYNMPMNAADSLAVADIPETESLQWADNVDGYRQFSGIASLAGRNVISNEMGATGWKAYSYTIQDLLFSIHKAFAGGVNRFILHGLTFTGNYYGTTYPGYTPFQYVFSDPHSPREPDFNNGFAEAIEYVSRISSVTQQGLRRIDVAFFYETSATSPTWVTVYPYNDLTKAGYDYTYLSTSNLKLAQATVSDGVLASDGPAFKALILTSQSSLTPDAIAQISAYAADGLRIIISGTPSYYPTGASDVEESVKAALAALRKQENVVECADGEVENTLADLKIAPQAGYSANGTWYTIWREDVESTSDYLFVLGDSQSTTGELTVITKKVPYHFDAWTGERSPVLQYTRDTDAGTVTIPLTLAGNQAAVYGFTTDPLNDVDTPDVYFTQVPPSAIGAGYTKTDGLTLKLGPASNSTQQESFTLSNGTAQQVKTNVECSSLELQDWTIVAEHWEAPSNLTDLSVMQEKRNTTHQTTSPLSSWKTIDNGTLAHVAGLGYYNTSFTWPLTTCAGSHDLTQSGAMIVFPSIAGARIRVNGQKIPPVDYFAPQADITPYLQEGENRLDIVVPSTLWNYLTTIYSELRSSADVPLVFHNADGTTTHYDVPGLSDNGIIGQVFVLPYNKQRVS